MIARTVPETLASPAPAPIVACTGLARRHGAAWALRGVDLTLTAGTATLLFGRNGAGKTTLIRLFASAMRPSAGDLRWFGASEPDRLRIAMLSHHDGHYDDLTALEHLDLGAALFPAPRGGSPARPSPSSLLDRVGLSARSASLVRTFSAGMRKRLAFARLIQKQADLVLLDEPYAALDPEGAALVDRLIGELRTEGRCLLVSTHQVPRAAERCDHAVQLDAGRIIWSGLASEALAAAGPI